MNRSTFHRLLTLTGAGLAASATLGLAQSTGAVDRLREFISEGRLSLNLRPRYEHVEHTNDEDAHAITLRTRLGYTTREWSGFQAMLELENVASPWPNLYNQSQLNPGGADRAIVTDPTGTEVNQAWIGWQWGRLTARGGRQRLNFDNGRFIGDYDWRQNMQTFDALWLQHRTLEHLTLSYAYIWRVNRVFGDEHPQGIYHSNSHAVHASYTGLPGGTLNAYAYLLEFDAPVTANSSATYGLNFTGRREFDRFHIAYRGEYAHQTNFGNSPLSYSANYFAAEVSGGLDRVQLGFGYEQQGSDSNFPFRTPLASLHNFNGWADVFVLIPAQGLRDTYGRISGRLPWWEIGLAATYHDFSTDGGAPLGSELDLLATYRISDSLAATMKYASFSRDSTLVPEVKKLWVQLELDF